MCARLRATPFSSRQHPARTDRLAEVTAFVTRCISRRIARCQGITPGGWRSELHALRSELVGGAMLFDQTPADRHDFHPDEVRSAWGGLLPILCGQVGAVWPAGGLAAVQVHGLWGVRCKDCLVKRVSGKTVRLDVGLWAAGCGNCQVRMDAIDRLATTDRATLQALHREAEGGDEVALLAAWDWQEEILGLARPGSGGALGLPEAGLWFPGVELGVEDPRKGDQKG